jgi:hypothetical protein
MTSELLLSETDATMVVAIRVSGCHLILLIWAAV